MKAADVHFNDDGKVQFKYKITDLTKKKWKSLVANGNEHLIL